MAPPALTPRLCLAIGLLQIASADGEFQKEEDLFIATVFSGREEVLNDAVRYVEVYGLQTFLHEANNILHYDQKLSLLINIIDLIYSDHQACEAEKEMFYKFMEAFGVDQATIDPHLKTIILKNLTEFEH